MATPVPAGTRCTYVATWNGVVRFLSAPQDFSQQVSDTLRSDNLTVEDSTVTDPAIFSLNGKGTITYKILDNVGHADLDDIRRVVDHEFYVAMGKLPDASRITDYTLPANNVTPKPGVPLGTGAPAAPPADGSDPTDKKCYNWLGLPTDCSTTSSNVAKTAGYIALAVGLGVAGYFAFRFGGLVKPS